MGSPGCRDRCFQSVGCAAHRCSFISPGLPIHRPRIGLKKGRISEYCCGGNLADLCSYYRWRLITLPSDRQQNAAAFTGVIRRCGWGDPHGERRRRHGRNRDGGRDRRDDEAAAGLIRTALLIAVAALAALALTRCERLFPDVEDWIADSETPRTTLRRAPGRPEGVR